jgi:hypothetical protein
VVCNGEDFNDAVCGAPVDQRERKALQHEPVKAEVHRPALGSLSHLGERALVLVEEALPHPRVASRI